MRGAVLMGTSLAVLAIGIAAPAAAQEAAGPPRTMESPTTVAPTTSTTPSAPQQQPATTSADVDSAGLQDIVVTAQRRSENIQRAALAITAVSGEQLETRGVHSAESLGQLTAGLQVSPSTGPYATFTVRGITQLSGNAFSDPSLAVNINGVYLASATAIHGLFYDLERVEVLKGPQGTLYGRNATAGAINIIPKRPSFVFGGEVGADVGNYGRFDFHAAVNVPLSETLALRVAGQRVKRGGYFSDGTGDEDGQAVRGQLLYQATPALSFLLTGDFTHQGGKGEGSTLRKRCASLSPPRSGGVDGNCWVADPFTAVSDLSAEYARFGFAPQPGDTFEDNNYYGAALNVDWATGLGALTFIAGYRKSDVHYRSSATSWQFLSNDHPDQKSAELRLASSGKSPLQYVFGAYYLGTSVRSRQNGENAATPNFSDQFNNLSGWTAAAFSQLTYSVTDTLRLVAGARYTHETKESDSRRYSIPGIVGPDPVIPETPSPTLTPTVLNTTTAYNRVNWKAGVEWDVAPRNLLYANVSTGFKAGGFFYGAAVSQAAATGTVLNACAVNCLYAPERVTSYVLGSKNRFLDNRLQLNVEAFYLDYRDQQISINKTITVSGALSSVLVTDNAGKSRSYGAEVEGDFLLTPTTRLGTQFQYLNSRYLQFSYVTSTAGAPPASSSCAITPPVGGQVTVDCSGQAGLRTPRWRVLASAQQTIRLDGGAQLVGEVDGRYETRFQSDVSYIPETLSYATARLDLSLSYVAPGDRFTIKAYVNNLTDVATIAAGQANNSYARTRIVAAGNSMLVGLNLQPPRTFGVRGQFKF